MLLMIFGMMAALVHLLYVILLSCSLGYQLMRLILRYNDAKPLTSTVVGMVILIFLIWPAIAFPFMLEDSGVFHFQESSTFIFLKWVPLILSLLIGVWYGWFIASPRCKSRKGTVS